MVGDCGGVEAGRSADWEIGDTAGLETCATKGNRRQWVGQAGLSRTQNDSQAGCELISPTEVFRKGAENCA